ncbi:MAG: hypothetical protein EOO39_18850 [Cytophagaceae bacterium]|nr:MAG: hypothetical protein EOO39_18850 [Cytophagaceae bacterium]
MKRSEKIDLLSKVLSGETSLDTARRLYESQLKPLIIIYEPHEHFPQPDDEVIVTTKDGGDRVLYKDLDDYARRVGGIVVASLPKKES